MQTNGRQLTEETLAALPDDIRIGTVGTALPGMTVRTAPDGEILLKGGNVCLGYLDDPNATAELIDGEGWMHTGDTGVFDLDGSLRIVGRKKEMILGPSGTGTTLILHWDGKTWK